MPYIYQASGFLPQDLFSQGWLYLGWHIKALKPLPAWNLASCPDGRAANHFPSLLLCPTFLTWLRLSLLS